MDAAPAREALARALQLAYSGELAAILAYVGHRASLPHGPDRRAVRAILVDEIRHRRAILRMLDTLGTRPDRFRERKMRAVGGAIAAFCRVGGWFLPMYGAARLERGNIVEYEVAARLAWLAGRPDLVDALLHYAEVEWDHERVLRELAASRRAWRLMPKWPVSPPRASIRARFDEFRARPHDLRRRTPVLVR